MEMTVRTKRIVWLASYPKSGNTWFRAFITALFGENEETPDINALYPTTIASSRQLFDEVTGISSADLRQDEIDMLRPRVYRDEALRSDKIIYHKTHDAFLKLPGGVDNIPADVTLCAVYFIRNPMDVAVSFANHMAKSIDRAIEVMNDPDFAFCSREDRIYNQLRQRLLTWSGHVRSWTEQQDVPVVVLRYEDMLSNPLVTFKKAIDFMGLSCSIEEVEAALEQCTFEKLKEQEHEKGFHEKALRSPVFFRKGRAGNWKEELTQAQVNLITSHHGEIMRKFGYLKDLPC